MSRTRPTWDDLPAPVRSGIEARLGGTVTSWVSHDGGYSPGPALTLTVDGERVFVKAADLAGNADAVRFHRREAEIAAVLPPQVPSPRLRWSGEVGGWFVLAFDAVTGRRPEVPWRADELAAVADLVTRIAAVPAPQGLEQLADRATFDGWAQLARLPAAGLETYDPWALRHLDRLVGIEPSWREAVAGDRLVHHDLRGDNVLLTASGAVVVDWPHAAAGAAFCDLVGWLPALRLEGGPPPSQVLASHPVGRAADPEAVTAFLVAIAGYFLSSSLQPSPPGIPHLRAFQRAQGEVTLGWLRERLGD